MILTLLYITLHGRELLALAESSASGSVSLLLLLLTSDILIIMGAHWYAIITCTTTVAKCSDWAQLAWTLPFDIAVNSRLEDWVDHEYCCTVFCLVATDFENVP